MVIDCLNQRYTIDLTDFMMNADFYPLIFIIFIVAGMVKGITGMGLPTVAISLLSLIMPIPLAIALLLIPSFVTNIWQMLAGTTLKTIIQRFWLMLLCVFICTLASASYLISVNSQWSSLFLGSTLIVYAGYALYAPSLHISQTLESKLSPIMGCITGLVTGATGVAVMPSAPYLQALNLNKEDLVQALGLCFTVSTLALALALTWQNAFQMHQFTLSTLAIIPALLGMWLGQKIRVNISPQRFKQCFLIFLVVLGLELSLRPFLV